MPSVILSYFSFELTSLVAESENTDIGQQCREYIENRLKFLESGVGHQESGSTFKRAPAAAQHKAKGGSYNTESDFTVGGALPKLSSSFVSSK